jgi:hypothetical protein
VPYVVRVAVHRDPWRDCRRCVQLRPCQTRPTVDLLPALESGALPDAPHAVDAVPSAPEVGRRWALALALRQGNTQGPTVGALVPLVERWAAGHGWSGPGHRALGVGLKAAGLMRRVMGGTGRLSRLLLHPESASLLKRLCREAWAPARPPGDPLRPWKPRPRPRKLPPAPFHAELKRAEKWGAAPLVDSTGRVWPSARHAAEALGCVQATVANALPKGGAPDWGTKPAKGLLWRRMLPGEVAAVPVEAVVGERVGGGWVLVGGDRK